MRAPASIRLLSQVIRIKHAENLHVSADHGDEEGHSHRVYGLYDEGSQTITLDSHLRFERARETFLHENLHAMMSMAQLDTLIEASAPGLAEHLVSALSPVLLSWMRENPQAVAYVQEARS